MKNQPLRHTKEELLNRGHSTSKGPEVKRSQLEYKSAQVPKGWGWGCGTYYYLGFSSVKEQASILWKFAFGWQQALNNTWGLLFRQTFSETKAFLPSPPYFSFPQHIFIHDYGTWSFIVLEPKLKNPKLPGVPGHLAKNRTVNHKILSHSRKRR